MNLKIKIVYKQKWRLQIFCFNAYKCAKKESTISSVDFVKAAPRKRYLLDRSWNTSGNVPVIFYKSLKSDRRLHACGFMWLFSTIFPYCNHNLSVTLGNTFLPNQICVNFANLQEIALTVMRNVDLSYFVSIFSFLFI